MSTLQKDVIVYNNKPINFLGDMLCLTDMWKAAEKPAGIEPAEWQRSADGARFIEFVAENQNMGISHVIKSKSGKGGGTWAHWQIAFAYAKKLSPEFHMWVNQAAREKMLAIAGGVQRAFPAHIPRKRMPSVTSVFRSRFTIGRLIGLDDNQAAIAAGRACEKKCGENPLPDMGLTYLSSPENERLLTATEIAHELKLPGKQPGQAGNALMKDAGLHSDSREKGKIIWTPTEYGMQFAFLRDVGKAHSDGSVQSYKWSHRVLPILRDHIAKSGLAMPRYERGLAPVPFVKTPEEVS